MAQPQGSASGSNSASVGSIARSKVYTNSDVVQIKPTTRNPEVWSHFDLCVMNDGAERSRCKQCGKFLTASANSTLRHHLRNSCKSMGQDPSQSSLGVGGEVFVYDNDALREAFTKFVIQQALPFNHFDNPKLTEIIKRRLQPRYQQVSRSTLRNDAKQLWNNAKSEIIEGFSNYNYSVSLTCDVWTAPHGTANSYLAVTAHWFHPESWLLMKRTVAFKIFGYPHTGCNLRKILHDTLHEYKLVDKVFTISLDNASNNTCAMDDLSLRIKPILDGAFFHSRCVAHVINLAVQAALKVCDDLRSKFRALLVTIYNSSNERQMNYRKFRKQCGEPILGPCFDNNTRWNSTCMMFENIIRQRGTLSAFNERLVRQGRSSILLVDQDWDNLIQLTKFLQVFKESTTILSGVYYPTSPLVLNQLYLMSEKLCSLELSPNRMFKKMVKAIKAKFVKYFASIPLVFTCSAALNPCLNLAGVELLIKHVTSNLGATYGPRDNDPDFLQNQLSRFNNGFKQLFAHYAGKYGQQQHPVVDPMRAGSSRVDNDLHINLFNTLIQDANKRQRSSAPSSELGLYQATDFISNLSNPEELIQFDILGWWKEKGTQFPILSAMARDLFAAQASTVASESAFSTSGRIISERRSRLTPESVEICVCLKDYLDGVDRVQNETSLEGPILGGDVEETIVREEVELGISPEISPPTTELDEGEFYDFDVEAVVDVDDVWDDLNGED